MNTSRKITSIITILLIILVAILSYYYKDKLYVFYRDYILKERENITITYNDYYKNRNYLYVSNTNDFIIKDKEQILDVFYTIINSGNSKFTFYCDDSYDLCISDIKDIAENQDILSNINNFVHPFNSFKTINTLYNEQGEITLEITKNYSEEDISKINSKVDEIIKKEITNDMTNEEKIKKIHNYIINNSKYASEDIIKNNNSNNYNTAVGVLLEGYGLCGSYADAMAIFLERFNINNYRIASDNHIWNLVNISNKWLHLDLTWDDPVTSDGSDKLEVLFLLITDVRLKELSVKEHNYDENVYLELKN